jgi:DNA-binding IclR family transcriptional regulator
VRVDPVAACSADLVIEFMLLFHTLAARVAMVVAEKVSEIPDRMVIRVATKIPAASRTIALLTTLASHGQPMTATALAKAISAPRSSTYQLLELLEAEGFVLHLPETARWGLGVSAFELGSAYLRHDPLERAARGLLKDLVRRVESLIPAVGQLGILQGTEVLYLLKELPIHPVTVVSDVGVRLPAHLTASGRAILSRLSSAQFRAIYSGDSTGGVGGASLLNRTGKGPSSASELKQLLRSEANQGYAYEAGHITEGYSSLAAAALNHLGHPVAALTLTFRSEAASESIRLEIAELLKASAAILSKRLGGQ